jgi:glycosyltransferase involved in cell wall biosynthesis
VNVVHVVVPEGIDDPRTPSGGNTYDRRICEGLSRLGWSVREVAVAGRWPWPDDAARAGLTTVLRGVPDGVAVLLDGLVASAVPDVLIPEADRLRLVVLVHLPLGTGPSADDVTGKSERTVLEAAVATLTTSVWTRNWLLDRYALNPGSVHVAEPGVDTAELAPGTATGANLLCVAAMTSAKGHDVLLEALATLTDLPWQLTCAGSLDRDPEFVEQLRSQAVDAGLEDRVRLVGPLTGAHLDAAYAAADLLVLASRAETYGMVVTEALARGLPVVTTTAGGLPEALGRGVDGIRPGLVVAPGDSGQLAAALRRWLDDVGLRRRLRSAAFERRTALRSWASTAVQVSSVLVEVTR